MNVADQVSEVARTYGPRTSVVEAVGGSFKKGLKYKSFTYFELEKKINQFSNSLKKAGVKKGDRALLFVRPCLEFSALSFALFKAGAVPVFIDPGMGRAPFLKAIRDTEPVVLIGTPKVILLSYIFRKSFKSIKFRFSYSGLSLPGAKSLMKLAKNESGDFKSVSFSADEMAAILFTSGGTGAPKGVVYTHDIFIKQTAALKKEFNLTHEDVDVPGFPLFALFTLSMGMKSVIPPMDPTRPAKADPKGLDRVIRDHKATFLAGSPAIWKNLGRLIKETGAIYPTVKSLVMFGAPIPGSLHEALKNGLPNGDTYTPYGATESLPVANVSGSDVLARREMIEGGKGVYIGKELTGVEVKVIKRTLGVLEKIEDTLELPPFEVGEVIVSSGTTTKAYFGLDEATRRSKIKGADQIWHRMGDVGYRDAEGGLWFCGRSSHVIESGGSTLYTSKVEAFFNEHPEVFRSALVLKDNRPSIVIQRQTPGPLNEKKSSLLVKQLKQLAEKDPEASLVKDFYYIEQLPVDVRHNIKIDRLKLPSMDLIRIKE